MRKKSMSSSDSARRIQKPRKTTVHYSRILSGECFMTYYGPKEIAAAFRTVRNNTIKVAEEIPEEHYGFRPAPGCRSVGETLVHIAIMPRVQNQIHFVEQRNTLVGFDFFGVRGALAAKRLLKSFSPSYVALE